MTTEAAKIVIDAEDLASKKFEQAARAAEANIKKIKETGAKAKASTEFFGTLANTLGGTQLGSYAGQLGALTEKVSAFSEVSKEGGTGALAFKAGLAAAVGVLAFNFGKAIGDVVFGTKQMTRELERAREAAAELDSAMLKATSQSFANEREEIELIRDPEAKEAAARALLDRLEKDVAGVTAQLQASRKAADEWADAWQITGDRKEFAKQAEEQVKQDKARLEQIKQQRDEVRGLLSERTQENELLKQQNALKDKSESFIEGLRQEVELLKAKKEDLAAIEAGRNTFGAEDRALAEQLIRERDLLKEKAEAEKAAAAEAERVAAKAQADAQKIEDIKANEIARLKEQRIELEQGAEAARKFALEQQGLDSATAGRLAAEAAALEKLREAKPEITSTAELSARESRLMTRGRTQDNSLKIIEYTRKTADELAKINRREDRRVATKQTPVVLKVGTA